VEPDDQLAPAGPPGHELVTTLREISEALRFIDGKVAVLHAAVVGGDRPLAPPPQPELPAFRSLAWQHRLEISVGVLAAAVALGIVIYMFTRGYR
jgi:hypothetical protein